MNIGLRSTSDVIADTIVNKQGLDVDCFCLGMHLLLIIINVKTQFIDS